MTNPEYIEESGIFYVTVFLLGQVHFNMLCKLFGQGKISQV